MIGSTISHYKILEKLGEGGMGVVYKAEDTTLDRFVALKFLPEHVSASADELQRFVQEAKAAAALNHPNICTIYGIEQSEGKNFIVMEFVDGQTLQEKKASLSMKQALDIGIQIAEGLATAHDHGIVHRDIKPENIMIRKDGRAQIMDFGLAKLRGASRLTKEGSTVGTAGYMSPEQVQGQDTDHRSDIFSLGVLLFEMLTKRLPFKAAHETAIAYEIVNVDSPPMSSINPEIPPELDAIVVECLEKDPNERAQSSRQVAIDLKRYKRESSRQQASRVAAARPVMSSSRHFPAVAAEGQSVEGMGGVPMKKLWILVAAVAVVMLCVGFAISFLKGSAPSIPPIRSSIITPAGIKYYDTQGGNSCISPDGTKLAMVCTDSLLHQKIYVRSMATGDFTALPGTDNALYPFWSADGKSIGFYADGKLKTIDAKGGPVIEVADAPTGRGAAWSSNGTILFSPSVTDANLYAVSAAGKSLRQVTPFDSSAGYAPRFPFFLPDGNHFLFGYLRLTNQTGVTDIYVGSLTDTATVKVLENASYAMFSSGYLFYLQQGILMTQPFDPGSCTLSGSPISLQGNINLWSARAKADFSVSDAGVLVFATGAGSSENELLWLDASGHESMLSRSIQPFSTVAISPDEKKVAYDKVDAQGNIANIFIFNLASRTTFRLTYGAEGGVVPCWSRDGSFIYYLKQGLTKGGAIEKKRSDGSGEAVVVVKAPTAENLAPLDESPDGRYLLISNELQAASNLFAVNLKDSRSPHTIESLHLQGSYGTFSPDGKWILYGPKSTGKYYISSFQGVTGKWQIPVESIQEVFWENGKIIYYSTTNNRFESCPVSFPNGIPEFGQPKPMFTVSSNLDMYGVSKDGKRYLCIRPVNAGEGSTLSMIVNWKELVSSN